MKTFFLGKRDYLTVLNLQEKLFECKRKRQVAYQRGETDVPPLPDVTLLVEHANPVYTLGRRDTSEGLPATLPRGVQVVKTKRGGGITYHGPGQLTMYPIANIQELWRRCTGEKVRSPIEWFSHVLEQSMIDVSAEYGVPTHRFKTGVWSDPFESQRPRKIGAIGLQLGNWVSMHGLGYNVATNVSYFDAIVMCELPGESATSLQQEVALRQTHATTDPPVASPLISVKQVVAPLFTDFTRNLQQPTAYKVEPIMDLSDSRDWDHQRWTGVVNAIDTMVSRAPQQGM